MTKINPMIKWSSIIILAGTMLIITGERLNELSGQGKRITKIEDKCKDYDKTLNTIQSDVSFIRGYITQKIK